MSAEQDVHSLLRLLTGPAKIPLAAAIPKAKSLIAAKLATPEFISIAGAAELEAIFPDEKQRKAVLTACKRTSQTKRKTPDDQPTAKRQKRGTSKLDVSQLPVPVTDDQDLLCSTIITTNRAPLLLAFAVVALEYTNPSQPLACRLSLAGGVMAANSITKATSIGVLSKGQEDNELNLFGTSSGQPSIKVLGRSIKCLRRYHEETLDKDSIEGQGGNQDGDKKEPWYWALNVTELSTSTSSNLPIHTPEDTLSYLNRSFSQSFVNTSAVTPSNNSRGKASAKSRIPPLPLLLGALHLLLQSWKDHLSSEELDRRVWGWYCSVRPEVPQGPSGWGAKGEVKLSNILDLRRGD